MKARNRPFRPQKKQTRLAFEHIPSSSPAKSSYSSAVQDRLSTVKYTGAKKRVVVSERDSDTTSLPTPEPSSQPHSEPRAPDRNHEIKLSDVVQADSGPSSDQIKNAEDGDHDDVLPSSKRRKLSTQASQNNGTPTRSSTRQNAQASTPLSLRSHGAFGTGRTGVSSPLKGDLDLGESETSGDDVDDIPLLRGKPTRHGKNMSEKDDPFVESEDEIVQTPRGRGISGAASQADIFVVGDDEVEYVSSEADNAVPVRKGKKGKRGRNKRRSDREQEELDDDLADLKDDSEPRLDVDFLEADESPKRKTRGGPVRTQKDKARVHLEELKRRRAGGKPTKVESDEDDQNFLSDFDEEAVSLDEVARPLQRILSSTRYSPEHISPDSSEDRATAPQNYEDEEEEDDFIVDDETQSQTDAPQIPLEFTSYATRSPRELFENVIRWLVKNKIAPAFPRNDQIYTIAWNKINDQIKAQAGSRLISSAWNSTFRNVILARPYIKVEHIYALDEEAGNCDACNRTNHPASYEFTLTGHAYSKDSLEPVDEDKDNTAAGSPEDHSNTDADTDRDDEGENNDTVSYDEHDHILPSMKTKFNLGSQCAANAEMGHKLTHWKFHLNELLLEYLEENGTLSAEAIVRRDRASAKKREKEADDIVDHMDATGEIAKMWNEVQGDLEDARAGMEGHYAKGRKGKSRVGKIRQRVELSDEDD